MKKLHDKLFEESSWVVALVIQKTVETPKKNAEGILENFLEDFLKKVAF